MAPLPAVIYAAKSTDDVRGSLPTQVADCEDAIMRAGGREIIEKPFSDNAATGYTGNRGPELAKAKAAAVQAAAAAGWKPGQDAAAELWVQHSDRLARGDGIRANHLLQVHFEMAAAGVALRSVQDDANLRNIVTLAVAGEQNTGYSKRLEAAVRSGKDRQMANGHRLGGPVPDGLRIVVERDASDKILSREYVRDDERAPIIEEAFAMAEAGHGDGTIAAALNRRGIRTQARTIRTGPRAGEVEPGKAWSRRRVQDMLTNQTYAARVVRYRGKPEQEGVPATNVTPLIDPERFDAIQAGRAQRDRSKAGREAARERGKMGGRPTTRYALYKLAHCKRCGSPMYCETSPYKRVDGTQGRSYKCAHVKRDTGQCDAPPVDAEAVDAAIIPNIRHFFEDFANWSQGVTAAAGLERQQITAQLDEARDKAATLSDAQARAQDRLAGYLAEGDEARADALMDALAKFKTDAADLAQEIHELQARLGSLVTEAAPSDAMLTYWRELAETVKGKLTDTTAMVEVNEQLRLTLAMVEIDTRADRSIELRAVYKRKGNYELAYRPVLDADGKIPDDPEYVPDWTQPPTFIPDDVVFWTKAQPRRGRRSSVRRPDPLSQNGSRGSGNHAHE